MASAVVAVPMVAAAVAVPAAGGSSLVAGRMSSLPPTEVTMVVSTEGVRGVEKPITVTVHYAVA